MVSVAARYEAVRRQVADAADACGRRSEDVTIVAVTKTVGVPEVTAALAAGMLDFGENRVQEFLGKYGLFPEARWHFIGTLQTNKVKDVVGKACLIHSVDSLRLLSHIDRRAAERGVIQPVLLQVNIAGETSKHGMTTADLEDVLEEASHHGVRRGPRTDDHRAAGTRRRCPLGLSRASGGARFPTRNAAG
jgi:PLP dependent protein